MRGPSCRAGEGQIIQLRGEFVARMTSTGFFSRAGLLRDKGMLAGQGWRSLSFGYGMAYNAACSAVCSMAYSTAGSKVVYNMVGSMARNGTGTVFWVYSCY